MKKILSVLCIATLLFASCSDEYDDSALTGRVNNLENRVAKLEELCKQMNTNISSLQTIVTALQKNDYVTGVAPITQNGKEIGYTISFSKSDPITIYHGKDGQDGTDGADGKPGADGQDGHTPVIGVNQDTDGVYYWTLDGAWLTDDSGNKIKAEGTDGKDGTDGSNGEDGNDGQDGKPGMDGKDGITPKFKIENDYWYISYDNESTWTQLGKATGEDGKDGEDGISGDPMFTDIDYETNTDYVIFTLSNGTQIKLPTWSAFEALKTLCNQMNTNISSLQTIVTALQNNDYITEITPVMQDGIEIGYTIRFNKSNPITIYHGKDGQNGTDGSDGKPGTDGQDGHTPVISVKQDTDGVYYWTLDGDWLTDDSGNKIKAEGTDGKDGTDGSDGEDGNDGQDGKPGTDGITPQFKIEDKCWWISYDNGSNWTNVGLATGADGQDGTDAVSIFKEITQDEDYIYFKLQDDSVISVPKHHPLSITFTETEDIRVLAGKTYSIGYTITGADENTVIKALAQDGFRAVVKKTDNATGTIEITTPGTILPSEVLIFVTDGKERTIMRSINFVEGVIVVTTKSYTVGYNGGTVTVDLSTNIDYTVEIPETDKSWISVADTRTRAVMRDETLTFTVASNPALTVRYSTIRLVDALGVTSETILITQKSGPSQSVHVATAGTLDQLINSEDKDIIEELTLTGKINTFDFDFIRTMKNLKALDLSETDNTTIPSSCLAKSTIQAVLLPQNLTVIPENAFNGSAIVSILIPNSVESIGNKAFYSCRSLASVSLPMSLTSIGDYAFNGCSAMACDLILPAKLQTIGQYAFNECSKLTGSLTIPDSVVSLGKYAFSNCSGFTGTLTFGTGLTEISAYCFSECSGFSGNLIIPDQVQTIRNNSFCNCTGFSGYLTIGSGVRNIEYSAFTNSYYEPLSFSKIYCTAIIPPRVPVSDDDSFQLEVSAFGYYKRNDMIRRYPAYLGVPTGCKDTYKQALSAWKLFGLIEEVEF